MTPYEQGFRAGIEAAAKVAGEQCIAALTDCGDWQQAFRCAISAIRQLQPPASAAPEISEDETQGILRGVADMEAGRTISLAEAERRLAHRHADMLEAMQCDECKNFTPVAPESHGFECTTLDCNQPWKHEGPCDVPTAPLEEELRKQLPVLRSIQGEMRDIADAMKTSNALRGQQLERSAGALYRRIEIIERILASHASPQLTCGCIPAVISPNCTEGHTAGAFVGKSQPRPEIQLDDESHASPEGR